MTPLVSNLANTPDQPPILAAILVWVVGSIVWGMVSDSIGEWRDNRRDRA